MKQREIKFKAWDKELKRMRTVRGLQLNTGPLDCFVQDGNEVGTNLIAGEFVLMQFTGLHDKNGKEIYEGDIFAEIRVKQESEPFAKVVYDNDLGAFTVEKTNGGWVYLADFLLQERFSEIIGNIYENPDLLTPTNQ